MLNLTALTNSQLIATFASAVLESNRLAGIWANTEHKDKVALQNFETHAEYTEQIRHIMLGRMGQVETLPPNTEQVD